jgi:hypothetical protein
MSQFHQQLNIVRQWEKDYDFITIVIIINLRFVTLCKVNLSVKRFDQLYIIVLNHLPCHDHNTTGAKSWERQNYQSSF